MRVRRWIIVIFSLLLGAFLTWLAFRGTDWAAVAAHIREARWEWLAVAAALFVCAEAVRAQRYGIVVRMTMDASYRHLYSAVLLGSLAQFVVPFRPGSFVRAGALARLIRKPFSACYGSVVFDRVPELATLGVVILLALIGLPNQEEFRIPPEVLGLEEAIIVPGGVIQSLAGLIGVMLSVRLGLLIALYLNRDAAVRIIGRIIGIVSRRAAGRACTMLKLFAESLQVLRSRIGLLKVFGWTAVFWGLYAAAYASVLRAFDLMPPWYAPLVMVATTAVALVLMGAPGLIGQYHLAVVLALVIAMPEVAPAEMKAVAIVLHALFAAIVTAMGVGALLIQQVHLFGVPPATASERVEP